MQFIQKTIGLELKYFDAYFDETLKSDFQLLNKILSYLSSKKGKQMRPIFVLLCARLIGEINERSYRAALIVEMLHTSTLVHDDVVDESLQRRGSYSVNALWKNRTSVFTGDYLFTNCISLLLKNNDLGILKIFSDSIGKVIECELTQMHKSSRLDLTEDDYYEIIKNKTAVLLASACAAGTASTSDEVALIEKLYLFGEKIGIAFQIKDDLLDYSSNDIGKPTGNDIKERKITLPLIFVLSTCSSTLKKKIIHTIKHRNTQKVGVDYLIQEVKKNGGITYAERKMLFFKNEALKILYEFPESDTRSALEELVFYAIDRIK